MSIIDFILEHDEDDQATPFKVRVPITLDILDKLFGYSVKDGYAYWPPREVARANAPDFQRYGKIIFIGGAEYTEIGCEHPEHAYAFKDYFTRISRLN